MSIGQTHSRIVDQSKPSFRENYGDLMDALKMREIEPVVIFDSGGIVRFQPNRFCVWLLGRDGGYRTDLNEMAKAFHNNEFDLDDYLKFYIGIGYSLDGFIDVFGELMQLPGYRDEGK